MDTNKCRWPDSDATRKQAPGLTHSAINVTEGTLNYLWWKEALFEDASHVDISTIQTLQPLSINVLFQLC